MSHRKRTMDNSLSLIHISGVAVLEVDNLEVVMVNRADS